MEIEPRYVDVAIRRWQAFTRKDAVDAESGRTFDQLAAERTHDDPRDGAARQGNESGKDEAVKETAANREGLQSLRPDNPRDGVATATAQRIPNCSPSMTPTSACERISS